MVDDHWVCDGSRPPSPHTHTPVVVAGKRHGALISTYPKQYRMVTRSKSTFVYFFPDNLSRDFAIVFVDQTGFVLMC